jgi:hypothetical protein
MGWPGRLIALAWLSLSLVACGRPREVEERKRILAVPSAAEQLKTKVERTRLFDDKGELQPSDEVVAGLRLPRGLTLEFQKERRWVYDTTVSQERLRAYFGPRLDTGSVSPGGGAVTYSHARARESQGEIFFDVVIGVKPGMPSHNFVDIRQYAPVPVKWPSDEEVRRQLAEAARNGH